MKYFNQFLDVCMLIMVGFFPIVTAKGYIPYFILLTFFNLFCFIRHTQAKMYLYALQPVVTQIMGFIGLYIR